MAKVWLEVALNGGWTRKRQPLIPVTTSELIEEGVACAEAGASIIHFHAYDEVAGVQNDDAESYATVIRGIRQRCDAIVYPTVPQSPNDPESPHRYDAVEALGGAGLLEWSVVDPGSVNFSELDDVARGASGYVYVNSEAHARRGMELARRFGYHPSYAIYEPGFMRLGAALHRGMRDVPLPVYRLMLTDFLAFGLPPDEFGLSCYRQLLEREHPGAPLMIAGRCSDILPLVGPAVRIGSHVRVGLEDAPLGTPLRNLDWVERAVDLIRAEGVEPASAAEVRAALRSGTPEISLGVSGR